MKTCTVLDCQNPVLAKNLCNKHYIRSRKFGNPQQTKHRLEGNTLCSKCHTNERRVSREGKPHSWCQPCLNESGRKWNASEAGPRWKRYKLKKSDIEAMKVKQDNCCLICKDSFELVADHVDHDSSCCAKPPTCGNCVRSLLCGSCNQGLGNFKDSPERLRAAADYLELFK